MTTGTYYKAVRPDLRDFYSGRVLYGIGSTVRSPYVDDRHKDETGHGWLFASNDPAETLQGSRWPARLLRLEGTPESGLQLPRNPNIGRFAELHVIDELEPWRAFGPLGQDVLAMFEQARYLSMEQIHTLLLMAYGDRRGLDELGRLRADAMFRLRVLSQEQRRSAACMAAGFIAATAAAAWVTAYLTNGPGFHDGQYAPAWQMTGDAASALVMRDVAPGDDLDELHGPWAVIAGEAS